MDFTHSTLFHNFHPGSMSSVVLIRKFYWMHFSLKIGSSSGETSNTSLSHINSLFRIFTQPPTHPSLFYSPTLLLTNYCLFHAIHWTFFHSSAHHSLTLSSSQLPTLLALYFPHICNHLANLLREPRSILSL